MEIFKNRYEVFKDLIAEASEFEDTNALKRKYTQAGAIYDIIEGDKVHDLSEDDFQHNVGTQRQVLQKKKKTKG